VASAPMGSAFYTRRNVTSCWQPSRSKGRYPSKPSVRMMLPSSTEPCTNGTRLSAEASIICRVRTQTYGSLRMARRRWRYYQPASLCKQGRLDPHGEGPNVFRQNDVEILKTVAVLGELVVVKLVIARRNTR